MQNGICEAFNGRMRDELLNETIFYDLDHARAALARWTIGYNQQRPHSALGYMTPAAFAAIFTATGARRRNPTSCADRPLLPANYGATFNPGLWRQVDERRGSQHAQPTQFDSLITYSSSNTNDLYLYNVTWGVNPRFLPRKFQRSRTEREMSRN
jgi:Integrase core domain